MSNQHTAAWTEADDALLRERYVRDGAVACAEALGRTFKGVARRAGKLSLVRVRKWTRNDDDRLTVLWGVHPIAKIAATLGRTPDSIYWRAKRLELGLGCAQGHEYLSRAAVRAGYSTNTMRLILRWAGVRIERAMARPDSKPRGTKPGHVTFVVEPADVDEAVARWCASEAVESAAAARGVGASVILRLLREAIARGDTRVPSKPRGRKHWRVPTVLIDELLGSYTRRESLAAACLRVGVHRMTLRSWLTAAGVAVVRSEKLDPADVDRVAAERLADPRCKVRRAA